MTEDRYNKLEEKIEALLVTSVRTEEKVSNLEKHTKKMVEKNHTNEYRINKMEIVQTEQFKFMTAWFNWFHK